MSLWNGQFMDAMRFLMRPLEYEKTTLNYGPHLPTLSVTCVDMKVPSKDKTNVMWYDLHAILTSFILDPKSFKPSNGFKRCRCLLGSTNYVHFCFAFEHVISSLVLWALIMVASCYILLVIGE